MKGFIHSTESFGSVDGPGVRFLIFLKGCDMRCRYCHNPDTWEKNGGEEVEAEELLKRALRYKSYWRKEGGITVSGGEALLQIDFLIELFEKAKEMGINTCLDTSAQPFTREGEWFEKFERLMKSTDLVLLDIKHIDNEEHKKLTGHGNENILDCARYLDSINKPIWIRHVLVPGITDADNYLKETRTFIDSLSYVQKVEVLPYHTLGTFKYEEMGISYSLKDVDPPTAERVANAVEILTK